jgi:rod shape-determining protein MreC
MLDSNWPDSGDFSNGFDRRPRDRVHAFVARRGAFFVLVAVLLAQLLLLSVQITRGRNVRLVHVWAAAVFSPLERGFHRVVESVASVGRLAEGLWRARSENLQLRAQLAEDGIRLQQLSEQAAEANQLRALLDFKAHLAYANVPAQVIAWSPEHGSAAVLINRGSADGVAKEMPVITPQGVVGKIIATFRHTSQVLLLTDPSSGAGCMLQSTRVQGVLRGESRGLCEMRYVMDDEKVETGDTVLSSGLDQIYPAGLIMGTVVRVEDGNIYKKIVVRPAVDLDRLEDVLIVLKPAAGKHAALDPARP